MENDKDEQLSKKKIYIIILSILLFVVVLIIIILLNSIFNRNVNNIDVDVIEINDNEDYSDFDINEVQEITKFVEYLNGKGLNEKVGDGRATACFLLASYPKVIDNEDFFTSENQLLTYECIHRLYFTMVKDNRTLPGTIILSTNEYDNFKKYFNTKLDKYDTIAKKYDFMDESDNSETAISLRKNVEKYYGKDYYYGYVVGDGYGSTGFKYDIKNVKKISSNSYEIIISSTDGNNNYEGVLTVQKVDTYFKYGKLIFKIV